MNAVYLMIATLVVIELAFRLPFNKKLKSIFSYCKRIIGIFKSAKISDFSKQRAISAYALRLALSSFFLFLFFSLLFLPFLGAVLLMDEGIQNFIRFFYNVYLIIILTVVVIVYIQIRKKFIP